MVVMNNFGGEVERTLIASEDRFGAASAVFQSIDDRSVIFFKVFLFVEEVLQHHRHRYALHLH